MRKMLVIGCILFSVILSTIYFIRTQQPQPVIQHFPIDDAAAFADTSTSLKKWISGESIGVSKAYLTEKHICVRTSDCCLKTENWQA